MLLADRYILHFRRHVFDSLARYIHQSLLHRPGKGERRLVVVMTGAPASEPTQTLADRPSDRGIVTGKSP
jgi:hypothetical protein